MDKTCDFCDGSCKQIKGSAFTDDGTLCYLDTDTNELVIYYESAKHRFVRFKIEHCPKCGILLEATEKEKKKRKSRGCPR